jgi:hypothetical protein
MPSAAARVTATATTRVSAAGEARRMLSSGRVSRVAYMTLAVARLIGLKVVERNGAAFRHRTVVAVVWVVAVIYVAVEAVRAMEPWAGTDEDTTGEPVRAVVAIGGAVVGRIVVVAIRADWGRAEVYTDGDLRGSGGERD